MIPIISMQIIIMVFLLSGTDKYNEALESFKIVENEKIMNRSSLLYCPDLLYTGKKR